MVTTAERRLDGERERGKPRNSPFIVGMQKVKGVGNDSVHNKS